MPVRRQRVANVENMLRHVAGLPVLRPPTQAIRPEHLSSDAVIYAPTVRAVSGRISLIVSTTGTVTAREHRVERLGATARDEAAWLIATTTFGAWLAGEVVPTREAAALGGVAGLVVGWRQLRSRG